MKRSVVWCGLLALVACGAPARPATTPPPAPAPEAKAEPAVALPEVDEALVTSDAALARPFLYLAEKDGRRVHLFGTVHIGIAPARLPPYVWAAIDASPVFMMETDVRGFDLKKLARKDGSTLDQELGPEYWAKFEQALGAQLAAGLKTMKTSVASAMLSLSVMPMTESMDEALRRRAEKAGAKVAFLEKPEFQDALLDRWMDVTALRATLDHFEESKKMSWQLLTIYALGDDQAVPALMAAESSFEITGRTKEEIEQQNRELLLDRNAAWIEPIEAAASEQGAFVAVGAAHLFGDGGVLPLLEARGWTVTRVER